MIQYVVAFPDGLDGWSFVLRIRIAGISFYLISQRFSVLTASRAWLRLWKHFGGRGVAGWDTLIPKLICLTSAWQKEEITSVVCTRCFTVLAIELTMVTSYNQPFLQAWVLYRSTNLLAKTGFWTVWINSIHLSTSIIVFASATFIPGYLQAGMVQSSMLLFQIVVLIFCTTAMGPEWERLDTRRLLLAPISKCSRNIVSDQWNAHNCLFLTEII